MRLTLRTLLAYLDDTLDPTLTKELGTRIAENEEVQALIERLRRITRRRGLAAPELDTDDETSDANTVAEYLDNELKPEQIVEVETAALQNDAYLAEIVSCHQILTLFLGEPAKVPPLARVRMYRLVTGPGSIPGRKPLANAVVAGAIDPMAATDDSADADDSLLMGLPRLSRGAGRLRRSLAVVAGLALAVVACIAVLLPRPTIDPSPMYIALAPTAPEVKKVVVPVREEPVKKVEPVVVVPKIEPEVLPVEPKAKVPAVRNRLPIVGPDRNRREVAKLESADALLLVRDFNREWQRVRGVGTGIDSNDPLLVLPGYSAKVRTATGVEIDFRSLIGDTGILPSHETRASLHAPTTGLDADLTLTGGRAILRSTAPTPVTVRVRFGPSLPESGPSEVWDITLPDNKCEVGLELRSEHVAGIPLVIEPGSETPRQTLTLNVIRGPVSVRATDTADFPGLLAGRVLYHDGKDSNPASIKTLPVGSVSFADTVVSSSALFRSAMETAIRELDKRLAAKDIRISVTLSTAIASEKTASARRMLLMEAMQAMEDFGDLIDAVEAGDRDTRSHALELLRHAVAQSSERDNILADTLKKSKNFTEVEAASFVQLLHEFDPQQGADVQTISQLLERMRSTRIGVREAAFGWMKKLDPKVEKEISNSYSALAKDATLTAVTQRWLMSWTKRNAK